LNTIGYDNPFVLYTKILSLLSDLVTDVRTPVFEKMSTLDEHFRAQKADLVNAATLLNTGMNTIYKALFLENFITY
jgi:hypothetical protein